MEGRENPGAICAGADGRWIGSFEEKKQKANWRSRERTPVFLPLIEGKMLHRGQALAAVKILQRNEQTLPN